MPDILVADIGGTMSRAAISALGKRPEHIVTVANDSVAGPEEVLERLLEGTDKRPRAAVLALAGPVQGDEITLTNRNWRIRLPELSARLGISPIHAINDFEALAWALPQLRADDLRPLGGGPGAPDGVKVVVGPGTGLGVAALVQTRDGLHAVASEAGHSSFGPAYSDEEVVFHRLAEEHAPLSAERLLSGGGLSALHAAMHPGTMKIKPEMIVRQAQAGDCEARASVAMFVRLLGRFAGDMALTFRATGGIYIAGGVAMRLGPLFDARLFRAAFERHPPYEAMLKSIPASLITCEEPGLIGCVAVAERLMRGA